MILVWVIDPYRGTVFLFHFPDLILWLQGTMGSPLAWFRLTSLRFLFDVYGGTQASRMHQLQIEVRWKRIFCGGGQDSLACVAILKREE